MEIMSRKPVPLNVAYAPPAGYPEFGVTESNVGTIAGSYV